MSRRRPEMILRLTNPHAVLAALQRRPADVLDLHLPPRGAGEAWGQAAERAQRRRIPVLALSERSGRSATEGGRPGPSRPPETEGGGRSGAAHGRVRALPGLEPGALWAGDLPGAGLWLALDRVQDPRNVGAIFRSAAFFGVRGVLLTRDQSAPLSGVAYDSASGGLEHVPFAFAPNLERALQAAKRAGLWLLGAAEEADQDVSSVDPARPWMLVLGGEEKGLRRLTRERCDQLCRITPRGNLRSLNVSVAAAVLLAALCRDRA